jgi:hypothetical protein
MLNFQTSCIGNALRKYDQSKGLSRKLFGDNGYIRGLKSILRKAEGTVYLREVCLLELVNVDLKFRFKISENQKSYAVRNEIRLEMMELFLICEHLHDAGILTEINVRFIHENVMSQEPLIGKLAMEGLLDQQTYEDICSRQYEPLYRFYVLLTQACLFSKANWARFRNLQAINKSESNSSGTKKVNNHKKNRRTQTELQDSVLFCMEMLLSVKILNQQNFDYCLQFADEISSLEFKDKLNELRGDVEKSAIFFTEFVRKIGL